MNENPIHVEIESLRGEGSHPGTEKYKLHGFANILETSKLADGSVQKRRCKNVRLCNVNGKFAAYFPNEQVFTDTPVKVTAETREQLGLPEDGFVVARVPKRHREDHRDPAKRGQLMYSDVGPQHADARSRELLTAACRSALLEWRRKQSTANAEQKEIDADSVAFEIPADATAQI